MITLTFSRPSTDSKRARRGLRSGWGPRSVIPAKVTLNGNKAKVMLNGKKAKVTLKGNKASQRDVCT